MGLDRMKSLRIRSIKMQGDSDGINQQVFEDEKQVKIFLTTSIEFENCFIDEGNLNMEETMNQSLNWIGEKDIIQLSTNNIPKGLIPLEELFDNNDVAKSPGVNPNNEEV